jgi:hypothetical protein
VLRASLAALFQRDLAALAREVEAYPDEASLWARPEGVPNSAGMLVRHLCGNLQHFVGSVLGGTGYRRDREAEFESQPWSRARLLSEIRATSEAIRSTLDPLPPGRLEAPYPQTVLQQELVTGDFLVHLAVHLGFHLGQVDYHRRVVTGTATSIGPTAIPALASARPATQ